MTTVAALRSQITTLRTRMRRELAPRAWCFCLQQDDVIPDKILVRIGEQDSVLIRYMPFGMEGIGQDAYCLGHVVTASGTFIVKPDGTLQAVQPDAAGRSRRR